MNARFIHSMDSYELGSNLEGVLDMKWRQAPKSEAVAAKCEAATPRPKAPHKS